MSWFLKKLCTLAIPFFLSSSILAMDQKKNKASTVMVKTTASSNHELKRELAVAAEIYLKAFLNNNELLLKRILRIFSRHDHLTLHTLAVGIEWLNHHTTRLATDLSVFALSEKEPEIVNILTNAVNDEEYKKALHESICVQLISTPIEHNQNSNNQSASSSTTQTNTNTISASTTSSSSSIKS